MKKNKAGSKAELQGMRVLLQTVFGELSKRVIFRQLTKCSGEVRYLGKHDI
jgi:hypothetical protein